MKRIVVLLLMLSIPAKAQYSGPAVDSCLAFASGDANKACLAELTRRRALDLR